MHEQDRPDYDSELARERASLPPWLRGWAGRHLDADSPPPTAEADEVRARMDRLGWRAPRPEPEPTTQTGDTRPPRSGPLRRAIDRLRRWP